MTFHPARRRNRMSILAAVCSALVLATLLSPATADAKQPDRGMDDFCAFFGDDPQYTFVGKVSPTSVCATLVVNGEVTFLAAPEPQIPRLLRDNGVTELCFDQSNCSLPENNLSILDISAREWFDLLRALGRDVCDEVYGPSKRLEAECVDGVPTVYLHMFFPVTVPESGPVQQLVTLGLPYDHGFGKRR